MKKIMWGIMVLIVLTGCGTPKDAKVAIQIGDIKITASEFESAFKHSNPSRQDSEAREAFLENYISKKLILKEAEKLGMDKDPEFLLSLQIFWEQALLKSILEKKSQEISPTIRVSDQDVKDYYLKYKGSSYANVELKDVYDQISWVLLKQKQSQAIQSWVESLGTNVKIEKDYSLLGIEK